MKTIPEMTAEVREVNVRLGWHTPNANTFGDYIALLHSELSEALEAYRDHRLADATVVVEPCYEIPGIGMCATHHQHISHCGGPVKPEGVGSEFADVLIRLLSTCDILEIDLDAEYARKIAYNATRSFQHGGRTLAENAG